jgi:hypothetical protein
MTTVDMVGAILKRTPGESLCDSCLAYCCSASFAHTQEITAELRAGQSFRKGALPCTSCRHTTPTTMYYVKCAHCSRPVGRDGLCLTFGGDHFHTQCWQRLLSDERIRISKALSQESRRLIERSRAVLKRPPPPFGIKR